MEKSGNIFNFMGIIDFSEMDEEIDFKELVINAIKGGVTVVVIKENCHSEQKFYNVVMEIKEICQKYGVPMIIHGNIKTAYNLSADGIELDFENGDLLYARRILGIKALIGAVVHDVCEALTVWAAGADYIVLDDAFEKGTVNAYLKEICERMNIPVVVSGGINPENMNRFRTYDINGVAVSDSLFLHENVYSIAVFMNEIINNMLNKW